MTNPAGKIGLKRRAHDRNETLKLKELQAKGTFRLLSLFSSATTVYPAGSQMKTIKIESAARIKDFTDTIRQFNSDFPGRIEKWDLSIEDRKLMKRALNGKRPIKSAKPSIMSATETKELAADQIRVFKALLKQRQAREVLTA